MGAQIERKRISHLSLNVLKSDFLEPLTLWCHCQVVIRRTWPQIVNRCQLYLLWWIFVLPESSLNNRSDSEYLHLYFDLHKHMEHSHADSPWLLSMSTEHKRDWPCCHVNVALFPWHVSRFLNVHFASVLQVFLRLFLSFANILQLLRFILLYFPATPFAQSEFPSTSWFIFIVLDHSSVIAIQILFDS